MEDKKNPIIIFLHGGPGFPLTYLSYYYQMGLEKDYTFVCLEQRGCGRTYYKNERDGISPELSIDLILSDLDDLVNYTTSRFGQEKVIIMGQSWGTVIGAKYTINHPEKVSSYIGVGQVIDFYKGKKYAANNAVDIANKQGNTKDVQLLNQAIANFSQSKSIDELDNKNLETMIINSIKYLKSKGEISGLKQMWAGIGSPNMPLEDLRWFLISSNSEKIFNDY